MEAHDSLPSPSRFLPTRCGVSFYPNQSKIRILRQDVEVGDN